MTNIYRVRAFNKIPHVPATDEHLIEHPKVQSMDIVWSEGGEICEMVLTMRGGYEHLAFLGKRAKNAVYGRRLETPEDLDEARQLIGEYKIFLESYDRTMEVPLRDGKHGEKCGILMNLEEGLFPLYNEAWRYARFLSPEKLQTALDRIAGYSAYKPVMIDPNDSKIRDLRSMFAINKQTTRQPERRGVGAVVFDLATGKRRDPQPGF